MPDTAEVPTDTTQLLQQLLEKLNDMNARIEMLEKSSVPSSADNATLTSMPALTTEAANLHVPNTSKPRQSLPYPPTFSGSKLQ
jgi:hypothetical protein